MLKDFQWLESLNHVFDSVFIRNQRSSKPQALERSVTLPIPASLPNVGKVRQSADRLQWGPATGKRTENLHWDEPRPGKDDWGPREHVRIQIKKILKHWLIFASKSFVTSIFSIFSVQSQAPRTREHIEWGPVPEKKQKPPRPSLATLASDAKNSKKRDPFAKWH